MSRREPAPWFSTASDPEPLMQQLLASHLACDRMRLSIVDTERLLVVAQLVLRTGDAGRVLSGSVDSLNRPTRHRKIW